jgi:GT2 family glycosyltransferase
MRLILVDNGSSDGTDGYLHPLGGIRVITNAENSGFPKAVNKGIRPAVKTRDLLTAT